PTRTAPASARAETGSAASSSARPARPAHACTEARFRAAHAARTASSPPRQTQPAGRAPRPLAPATQPLPPSSPPLNDDRYRGHRSRRTDRTLQRANKVLLVICIEHCLHCAAEIAGQGEGERQRRGCSAPARGPADSSTSLTSRTKESRRLRV